MGAVLILLGALFGVGLTLYLLHRREGGNAAEPEAPAPQPEECCGQHAVCERDSLLTAMQEAPEYFDDEELDAFRGRAAGEYSADEAEAFREVLLTLRPEDVAPWARSIQLRGIELPADVRDELLLLVSERRNQ